MSASDSELEGQIDPFATREVLRWMERQKSKPKGMVDWETLRKWLERLRISENDVHAGFFSSCAAFVGGVKTGEFDQKDSEGRAKLGDLEVEAADYLYDHVAEVERGTQAG